MASNQARFIRNIGGAAAPFMMLGNFAAGSSVAIKQGELLELTGGGSTQWVPMDSNYAMSANVAIAAEEIKSGDLAGYYWIYVPRRDDIWEYDLDTANNTAVGTALYWSSSEAVTETAGGGNVLGYVCGQDHYPLHQNHASAGVPTDMGTTIKSSAQLQLVIREACSYISAFIK
jgi:predicted RecA/RadA family phage recombinase